MNRRLPLVLLVVVFALTGCKPGTEPVFPSSGKQLKARCTEIDRSAVVLTIEGQEASLRLVLP